MSRVSYPSLEHLAMDRRAYPSDLLAGCESGLCLFAAAFLGRNDVIHFAEAGVPDVTLVDVDGERLREMGDLYRDSSWRYFEGDAWAFARDARELGVKYDAVSVDTFTGTATDRSLAGLEEWTAIANRVVIATAVGSHFDIPVGWYGRLRTRRSDLADWLVLRPTEPAS